MAGKKKNCWERRKSWVPEGKIGLLERAQLANQIQGFRIPDRSDG